MSDDKKKFDIELGTKADTSGLEQAERALRAVEEAGKDAANPMTGGSQLAASPAARAEEMQEEVEAVKDVAAATEDLADAHETELDAQRRADVERARAIQGQRQQEESIKGIDAATRRLVSIQLAAELNQIAQQFRGASKEGDLMLDGINAMAAGLISGNPYVAIGHAAISAGMSIHKAYQELEAAEKYASQSAEEGTRRVTRALQERELEVRRGNTLDFWERERAALDEASDALERNIRLLESRRGADTAVRENDQKISLLQGADPGQIDAADRRADVEDFVQGVRDQFVNFEAKQVALQNELAAARLAYSDITRPSLGASQQQIDEAMQRIDDAQAALSNLAKDVAERSQTVQDDVRIEVSNMALRTVNAIKETGDQATAAAEEALRISAESAERLGGLSVSAAGFTNDLIKLLEDKIPNSEQADKIRQAIEGLRSTLSMKDQATFDALTEAVGAARSAEATIRRFANELRDVRSQMESLRNQ